ncbi:MAG: DUF4339 domain-containing protein [Armatimonadota bacterium]
MILPGISLHAERVLIIATMQYFLIDGSSKRGPYTVAELRGLATAGELVPEDLLTTADEAGRIRAGLVVGIFGPHPSEPEEIFEQAHAAPTEDNRGRRRFLITAVSLLLVALIVPFAAAGLTAVALANKTKLDRKKAAANLSQLVHATFLYASDNDDRLPELNGSTDSLVPLLMKYDPAVATYVNVNQSSPVYNITQWDMNLNLSCTRVRDLPSPNQTPLFYDPMAWRDGKYLVAMADGTISTKDEAWNTEYRQHHANTFRPGSVRRGKPSPAAAPAKK